MLQIMRINIQRNNNNPHNFQNCFRKKKEIDRNRDSQFVIVRIISRNNSKKVQLRIINILFIICFLSKHIL